LDTGIVHQEVQGFTQFTASTWTEATRGLDFAIPSKASTWRTQLAT